MVCFQKKECKQELNKEGEMITAEQAEFLRARIKEIENSYCQVSIHALKCEDCDLYHICSKYPINEAVSKLKQLLAEYESRRKFVEFINNISEKLYKVFMGNSETKQEDEMSEKELKFQDRTRGGHEYRIYTREGMSDEFPLVGEALRECGWDVQCWTKDGRYYNSDDESEFDLIPVESAELEGLTVGDKVYGYDDKITSHDHVREFEIISEHLDNGFWISYSIGLDKMPICYDGAPIGFGNGQQMFYRSKERALASVKSDKNAE